MASVISLATCLYFAVANVGSFGSADSQANAGNVKVRRNFLSRMRFVTKQFGEIEAFLGQETGSSKFLAAPFFNGPLATNKEISYTNFNPRGVCTFSTNGIAFINPHQKSEIVTTTHSFNYRNKRRRIRQCTVGILNIYRNHGQPLSELISQIQNEFVLLKQQDISKFLCVGDFNSEFVDIPGLREVTHPQLFHKHNSCSQAKFIDKIFTNLHEVEVVSVDESVENKGYGLGHKFFVVRIGEESRKESVTITKVNPDRLRKATKQLKIEDNSEEFWFSGSLEQRTEDICSIFGDILKSASVTRTIKTKSASGKTVTLDDIENKITDTSDKDVQKNFYNFVDIFRKKKVRDTSTIRPKIDQFTKVLETKLLNLNIPDLPLVNGITREAHHAIGARNFWANKSRYNYQNAGSSSVSKRGVQLPKTGSSHPPNGPTFPTRNQFKKHVFSLSNSNAKDFTDLSTKNLKTILRYNDNLVNPLYFLCKRIFSTGLMPNALKQDKISFLYKRKGGRDEASNYRPITIAPTIGKIVEKILAFELDKIDDGNPWNHAYRKGKSTQSAVLNAIEMVTKYRAEAAKLKALGYNASVIILAEDISSAFESIDGDVICSYLQPFDTNPDFKICSITRSYLDRDSRIYENDDTREVNKLSRSRSSPQGSILSCRYWRIFDGLATRLYMNSVNGICAANRHLQCVSHISYADDHLTLCLVVWNDENDFQEISHVILGIRRCFDDSTKAIGCGMNIKKSEIVTTLKLKNIKASDYACDFIWLGYSLCIKDDELCFDNTKFEKKKNEIRKYVREIFQYSPTISIRRKIFITYISPIIDYYLPSLIMTNQNSVNDLEKFQKEILKKVLGVPFSCPGNQVERVLRIDPVQNRLFKACNRYKSYLITSPVTLPNAGMRTRSKLRVCYSGKDISSRVHWIANSRNIKNFNRNKKFSPQFANSWALATNARFSKFCASVEQN